MPKRLGRPRLDPADQSVLVSVSLTRTTFDRLCTEAIHAHVSVPEVIRQHLRRAGGIPFRGPAAADATRTP